MKHIDILIERYPQLAPLREDIQNTVISICEMHKNGGKLLLCGNGGSCADCEHISGELLKGFLSKRPLTAEDFPEGSLDTETISKLQKGIGAIPLPSLSALLTAFSNDVDPSLGFSQLVLALGKKSDVFLGISTSGNAANVATAAKVAKALGITTVGLSGGTGGKLKEICDICICVPEKETFKVQELHLPVYHAICAQCEELCFQ